MSLLVTSGLNQKQLVITRGLGGTKYLAPPRKDSPAKIPIALPYLPMRIPLPTAFPTFPGVTIPVPAEVELEPEQIEAFLAMLRDSDEFLVLLN